MAEGETTPCDVDDIICQVNALSHLKGLKTVLGNDRYRSEFPELQGLEEKIASREVSLKESLGRCGIKISPELSQDEQIIHVQPKVMTSSFEEAE